MPSNLSHIQLFFTGLKTPLPPRPTKPSSRLSFSTSVKHRTRSIPVFESSLNEEILWRIHSCIWSISRQLSNQESCRRIRFFDGNYIDSYEFYFIFFFSGGKFEERNVISRQSRELGQKKRSQTGLGESNWKANYLNLENRSVKSLNLVCSMKILDVNCEFELYKNSI